MNMTINGIILFLFGIRNASGIIISKNIQKSGFRPTYTVAAAACIIISAIVAYTRFSFSFTFFASIISIT